MFSALWPLIVTVGGAGGVVAGGAVAAVVGGTVAVAVAAVPGRTVLPPGKARASGATKMAIIARMATTVTPVSRRFMQPLHLSLGRAASGTFRHTGLHASPFDPELFALAPAAGACLNETMVRRLGQAVNLGARVA